MFLQYKIPVSHVLIGVLIAVIIGLVSINWYNIPNLAGLITFALTVTSLVISVLAIGYAVVSNFSFSQNITSMNTASQEISTTAKDVSEAAKELKGKIEAIPPRLESMEGKFEQLMLISQTTQFQSSNPSEAEKEVVSEITDVFIKKISPLGWLGTYIAYLSLKKNKPFNILQFSFSNPHWASYLYGTHQTMGAMGFVKFTDSGDQTITTFLDHELTNLMKTQFKELLEAKLITGAAPEERERFTSDIEKNIHLIESYFAA
jgi:hypothetical protein